MSFYTDWFIADAAEAENLAASDSPFDEWPSLSLGGIGEIDLMALGAILQGKEADEAEHTSEELLFQGSDEGPFVVRVAPGFVSALADVRDTDQSTLAAAWGRTEGLVNAAPPDVAETLAMMTAFAKQSRLEGKPILSMFAL